MQQTNARRLKVDAGEENGLQKLERFEDSA